MANTLWTSGMLSIFKTLSMMNLATVAPFGAMPCFVPKASILLCLTIGCLKRTGFWFVGIVFLARVVGAK